MDFNKRFIEFALYPAMELLRGNHVRRYLRELKETEKLTPEELRELQRERLTKLLLHCIEHVPAYRPYAALREEILADPHRALLKFPPLERSEFTRHPEQYLADNAHREELIENKTGGSTTGEPVKFYMDRTTVEHYEAARFRGLSWWGITPGSRSVMLWGHPLDLKNAEQESFRRREKLLKNRTMISAFSLYERDMPGHVEYIDRYRPEYLYGYATPLNTFAELMLELNLRLSFTPKAVVSTSETLQPHYIPTIEKAFGCPVVNEYGARDGGIIAYSAPCGHMHVTAENACYEVLDLDAKEPAGSGESGRVAVTDLFNFVQPRLRYLLGDMAAISDTPCPCGRGLPVMDHIDGRYDDMFVLPDGKLFWSYIFTNLAKTYAPDSIAELQVVQYSPTVAELKYVRRAHAAEAQVERFLREAEAAMPGCELKLQCVESIPKTASGKTRYAIRKFDLPRRGAKEGAVR